MNELGVKTKAKEKWPLIGKLKHHINRPFKYIDTFQSESAKKVSQSLLTTLIFSTLTAIGTSFYFIWTHKEAVLNSLATIWKFFQSSFQIKFWVLLLMLICAGWIVWLIMWLRRKNREIKSLESTVFAYRPLTPDQKVAGLFGALSDLPSDPLTPFKPIATEYSQLLEPERKIDTIGNVYKLVLDLQTSYNRLTRNRGADVLPENTKAYEAKLDAFFTFYEPNKIFLPETVMLSAHDAVRAIFAARALLAIALVEAKSPNRKPESYGTLFNDFFAADKQIPKIIDKLTYEIQKALGVSKADDKAKRAVDAIYKGLLPMLDLWENCVELIGDESEDALKERQATFQKLGNEFGKIFDENKLKISDEQLLKDILEVAYKMRDFAHKSERARIFNNIKGPKNPKLLDAHMLPIEALENEIPELRKALEAKIRRFLSE